MVTTARIETTIGQSLDAVVDFILPENWPRVSYFKSVFRVLRDSESGVPIRRGADRWDFERDVTPLPPSSWNALFYEHVELEGPTDRSRTSFHNLLDMTFDRTERSAELSFHLNLCLSTQWGPVLRFGGIDVDRGYTRLERLSDGSTRFETSKSVRYTPFAATEMAKLGLFGVSPNFVNELAPAFLLPWMESVVSR